jgi:hypothetical protein
MPDFKHEIRERLAELGLSPVREAEIVEELSQHLEEEYERALSCGSSDDEARQQALEQLNAPDLLGRELKDVEHRGSPDPAPPGLTNGPMSSFVQSGPVTSEPWAFQLSAAAISQITMM